MEKRPDALIEIALRALRQTRKFLGGRALAAYLADDQCQSAVERQLEIAGDALGGLRKLDAALFGRIPEGDRKSTCLNSRHEWTSYAVFCRKKKKTPKKIQA